MKLQIEGNRRTVQYAALQPVGTKPVQRAIDSHTATQIIHQYKYRVDGIIKAHVTVHEAKPELPSKAIGPALNLALGDTLQWEQQTDRLERV